MTTDALARFRDLLELEIGFYRESHPPARYRLLCKFCRIRPRHEVIIDELEGLLDMMDMMIAQEETERINAQVFPSLQAKGTSGDVPYSGIFAGAEP